MTLWELAQEHHCLCEECGTSIPHKYGGQTMCPHPQEGCTGCHLEEWAKEHEAQWVQNAQDHGQRNGRENELAWAVTMSLVSDLGVPED